MKNYKHTKILVTMVSMLIIVASIGVFAGFSSNASNGSDGTSAEWFSEKTTSVRPANFDDEQYLIRSGKAVAFLSFYPEALTTEELLEQTALVVRGKVIGFDYLTIEPVFGGSPMVHTDYYIEPLDVLRGVLAEKNPQITIRARGGENDNVIVVNECLSLTVGEEYLFFLDKAVTGGGYNTEGEYYYISGGTSGLFESGRETLRNEQGLLVPKTFYPYTPTEANDKEIDYLSFANEIKSYNKKHPVDEMFLVNRYYSNINANVESGFITQEEYDQAIKDLSIYARISQ